VGYIKCMDKYAGDKKLGDIGKKILLLVLLVGLRPICKRGDMNRKRKRCVVVP
jgi:hypothetical protein